MRIFRIHCAILLIITFPLSAMAQGSENGFWGSLDAGWANVNFRHSISGSHTSGEFAMDFYGGYHWAEEYYGAIELGGLNLEATEEMGDADPTKGVGIQHAMLSLRYYGDPEVPWFLLGAAGKAHYWTNHVGENGGWGNAFELGAGRDIHMRSLAPGFWFTPVAKVSAGNISGVTSPPGITQNIRYRAFMLVIGITYR